jgi:hypothetical protein
MKTARTSRRPAADRSLTGICSYPHATIRAFAGLAVSHDVDQLLELAEPFLGAPRQNDPTTWIEGDPTT